MKNKKRKAVSLSIVFGLLFCFVLIFSQKAEAITGLKFQPRAALGWMDYSMNLEPRASLADMSWNLSDNVPVASIGATFLLSNFYLDLFYLHTGKGNSVTSGGTFLEVDPKYGLPLDADVTVAGGVEFYHWSYAITLGYQLLDNLTFYVGYKHNDTSYDFNLQSIFHMIDDGSITGTPGFPISSSLLGDIDIDYEANGPFLGGTYGFIIGDKGVLSLNLAVAFLDGDITQTGKYIDPRTGTSDDLFNLNSSGKSIGLSYGIGWGANISERVGYSIVFSGYNYDFEADNNNQLDFNETTYQFSLGLSYNF